MPDIVADNPTIVETAPGRATPDVAPDTATLTNSTTADNGRGYAESFVARQEQEISPDRRSPDQQLEALRDALSPEAREDLDKVLDNPNATQAEKERAIKALLDMVEQPRRDGIDGVALAESTLNTMADPYGFHQADRRSCACTTMSRMAQQPALYAEMMEGITSREGSYTFESGATIDFVENSEEPDVALDPDRTIETRALDVRIAQSAMCQFYADVGTAGTGIQMQYDPARDVNVDLTNPPSEVSGIYHDWLQRGNNLIFNEGSTRLDSSNVVGGGTDPTDILHSARDFIHANEGEPVVAEITTGTSGDHALHYVAITDVKMAENPHTGQMEEYVYFDNTWEGFHQFAGCSTHERVETENGPIERMTVREFNEILRSATIPDNGDPLDAPKPPLQADRAYNPNNPATHHMFAKPPTVEREETQTQTTYTETHDALAEFVEKEQAREKERGDGLVERGAAASRGGLPLRDDEEDMFK